MSSNRILNNSNRNLTKLIKTTKYRRKKDKASRKYWKAGISQNYRIQAKTQTKSKQYYRFNRTTKMESSTSSETYSSKGALSTQSRSKLWTKIFWSWASVKISLLRQNSGIIPFKISTFQILSNHGFSKIVSTRLSTTWTTPRSKG